VLCEGHALGIGTSVLTIQSRYSKTMPVPLQSLNLWCNPFGEPTPAERCALAVGDFEELAAEPAVLGTAL
jgi:hypothetical protein